MTKRVLVDTDVILDVALAREPFLGASCSVLALLEVRTALGYVTSNGVANLYYILRKIGGDGKARLFLSEIIRYLTVLSIDHSDVVNGLKSGISDLEDAFQQYAAFRNRCDCVVTRNTRDYVHAGLGVFSPGEFLNQFRMAEPDCQRDKGE